VSATPTNDTTDVNVDQDIVVTFSEAMNTSSLQYSVTPNPGGLEASWNSAKTTLTISHSAFSSSTSYTVQVTSIKDEYGNELTSSSVQNPWSFTAADIIDPYIVLRSPSNNTHNVGINSDIQITFNEAIDTTSLAFSSSPNPGGWSVTWSSGDRVATISHFTFLEKTEYTFTVTGAKDLAGNDLTSANRVLVFTTADVTDPYITEINPGTGSTGAEPDQLIVVKFSEPMDTGTLEFSILPSPGGVSATWANGNRTVSFTHDDFASDSLYTVYISYVEDEYGNELASGSIPNPWYFRTRDTIPPIISAITPLNSSQAVEQDASVVITFNEAMNYTSLIVGVDPNPGGWSATWNAELTEVTLGHDDFEESTQYTFVVYYAEDISGNVILAMGSTVFTTRDLTSPAIILTSPANGDASVGINQNISIVFSESIDPDTFAYTLSPNVLGWSETWSSDDKVVTLSHDSFASNAVYVFQVITAKDYSGNSLTARTCRWVLP